MRILVDMNLSPRWVPVLKEAGFEAIHWSDVGDPRAPDRTIMDYAKKHRYVVFTHDLDFGAILAATQAEAPSVIQVRTGDISPEHLAKAVVTALRQCRQHLEKGALISMDEANRRARILPLRQ